MINLKISIIMPTYNVESIVERGIISILNQSYKNFELIVIDDGSEDGTYEIVRKVCSSDPRCRVFSQANSGVSAARNFGLINATGDYVMFVDSDDWIDSFALEILVQKLSKNLADIIFTPAMIEYQNRHAIQKSPIKKYIHTEPFTGNPISMGFPGYVWNYLFSSKIVKFAKFDENISVLEDLVFIYTLSEHQSLNVAVNSKHYYHYRSGRIGSLVSSPDIKTSYEIVKARELLLQKAQNDLDKITFTNLYADALFGLLRRSTFDSSLFERYSSLGAVILKSNYNKFSLKSRLSILAYLNPSIARILFMPLAI